MDGDGFQHDGNPKNSVGLDRAGRCIRMSVLVEFNMQGGTTCSVGLRLSSVGVRLSSAGMNL